MICAVFTVHLAIIQVFCIQEVARGYILRAEEKVDKTEIVVIVYLSFVL